MIDGARQVVSSIELGVINENYSCRSPRRRSAGGGSTREACNTARFPRGGRAGTRRRGVADGGERGPRPLLARVTDMVKGTPKILGWQGGVQLVVARAAHERVRVVVAAAPQGVVAGTAAQPVDRRVVRPVEQGRRVRSRSRPRFRPGCRPRRALRCRRSLAVGRAANRQSARRDLRPYTCESFESTRETDIEHVLARSEAHDSGLCAADSATKRRFAVDIRNLTLASPPLNRQYKRARDASSWHPEHNRCRFAQTVVQIRQAYGQTIDQDEVHLLNRLLAGWGRRATSEVVRDAHAARNRDGRPARDIASETSHPPVQAFANCSTMRSAGWDDAQRRTYALNTGSDGHACE